MVIGSAHKNKNLEIKLNQLCKATQRYRDKQLLEQFPQFILAISSPVWFLSTLFSRVESVCTVKKLSSFSRHNICSKMGEIQGWYLNDTFNISP